MLTYKDIKDFRANVRELLGLSNYQAWRMKATVHILKTKQSYVKIEYRKQQKMGIEAYEIFVRALYEL